MSEFIQYLYATVDAGRGIEQAFGEDNLPAALPNSPTVILFREQVRRFRESYGMLLAFAEAVLGVPAKDITPLHMMLHEAKSQGRAPPHESKETKE